MNDRSQYEMRKTARIMGFLDKVINNDGSVNEAEYKRRLQEAFRKQAEGVSLKEKVTDKLKAAIDEVEEAEDPEEVDRVLEKAIAELEKQRSLIAMGV